MVFGGLVVAYVAFRWDDTAIASTLALGGFGLITAALATYTGARTFEDTRPKEPEA